MPIMNVQGGRMKLPPRHVLGTWEPLDETMTAIDVTRGGEPRGGGRVGRHAPGPTDAGAARRKSTSNRDTDRQRQGAHVEPVALLPTPLEKARAVPTASDHQRPPRYQDLTRTTDLLTPSSPLGARELDDRHSGRRDVEGGVFEESSGAWYFPVVLVRKRDGSVRLCELQTAQSSNRA